MNITVEKYYHEDGKVAALVSSGAMVRYAAL